MAHQHAVAGAVRLEADAAAQNLGGIAFHAGAEAMVGALQDVDRQHLPGVAGQQRRDVVDVDLDRLGPLLDAENGQDLVASHIARVGKKSQVEAAKLDRLWLLAGVLILDVVHFHLIACVGLRRFGAGRSLFFPLWTRRRGIGAIGPQLRNGQQDGRLFPALHRFLKVQNGQAALGGHLHHGAVAHARLQPQNDQVPGLERVRVQLQ